MSRIGRHIFDKQEIDEALDALIVHTQQLSRSLSDKEKALTPKDKEKEAQEAYIKLHKLPF